MNGSGVGSEAVTVPYQDFVWRLCKPGEVLLGEMTASKVHMWHMVSAILGEAAELTQCMEALAANEITREEARENVTEELGDLDFYCVGCQKTAECQHPKSEEYANAVLDAFNATDFSLVEAFYGLRWNGSPPDRLAALTARVVGAAERVFDIGKQWFIYNKAFDRKSLEVAIMVLQHTLKVVRLVWELTEQEVEDYNRRKLQLRYNKLVYSDQHAHERADKQ